MTEEYELSIYDCHDLKYLKMIQIYYYNLNKNI